MKNKLEIEDACMISLVICCILMAILVAIVTIAFVIDNFKPKYNVYDVNHDRQVNALDLLKVQKYILEQNDNS